MGLAIRRLIAAGNWARIGEQRFAAAKDEHG